MTESSSFSSLLALVDSHLSKSNVEGEGNNLQRTCMSLGKLTLSDSLLSPPGQRLPIPTLSASESPITDVLAKQLFNMMKSKELKAKQEAEEKLAESMKKLKVEEENSGLIDLMCAVQMPDKMPKSIISKESLSCSSSLESLLQDNSWMNEFDDIPKSDTTKPELLLPCKTDMSYILKKKIKKGRCSAFGKVLTAHLRPVAMPYLREKIDSNIVRFDFKTKSPCDLVKEKLRRPTRSYTGHIDILGEFL